MKVSSRAWTENRASTEESAIVSCKQSVADAPPGLRNCVRSLKRIVAALWEPHGGRIAKFARRGIPTITTSFAWTKDFPLMDKTSTSARPYRIFAETVYVSIL